MDALVSLAPRHRAAAEHERCVPPRPRAELALSGLDVRALARRAAVLLLLVAVAAAVLLVAGGSLHALADALQRAVAADPRWVAAAAGCEVLSFAGYVLLLWLVGSRATTALGLRASVQITLSGAAATRLLPTAGVGGAALTLWALRRAGLPARRAIRTLLGFLVLLYGVFFGAVAVSGGLIAAGLVPTRAPLAVSAVPAALATLGIAGALALAAAARRPQLAHAPPRRLTRARGGARTFGEAVGDALRLVGSADPRLLGALAWWTFDAAVLWAMLHAFGAPPAVTVVVLAYCIGQIGNTLPIPGAVSGGMVGALLAFGVQADLALTSVLAYRAAAIWLPAPAGLLALGALKRTVARWRDAQAPPSPQDDRQASGAYGPSASTSTTASPGTHRNRPGLRQARAVRPPQT